MDEYEIRELCEAFFDAYENRRVDVIEKLYADDCIVWHNVFGAGHQRSREPGGAARRLQRPAPPHLQRPHHQHVRRRVRDPVHAQRGPAQRPPGRAVDLHRRPVPRRQDHAHRRVHGLGQVRGVGGPRPERSDVRKDWQTLELCDRFFDAIEQNDYDTLESCYAPEAIDLAQPRLPLSIRAPTTWRC